ncbi:hypothetical protein BS17DRAFT_712915 [Gyrodon lividus]|nr:hypothetical protein BS17DRAFT_712915 [Gyrodon lividus]
MKEKSSKVKSEARDLIIGGRNWAGWVRKVSGCDTLKQRIKILDWHDANGRIQMKTTNHFHAIYPNLKIKQPLISAWVKNEARWHAEYESTRGSGHSAKRIRQTQHPEVTEMLDLWVSKTMADTLLLTGKVLCQKWKIFADLMGVPDDKHLNLSDRWLMLW